MDLSNPAALVALLKGDIANAVIAGTPGGIEAQEAAGQRALVSNFNRLPQRCIGPREDALPRDMLERLGFKIGDNIDDLFVSVTPPAGWTMLPTEHSMHSDVFDSNGRRRFGVFYSAAFYDRKAHLYIATRYSVGEEYRDAAGSDWDSGEARATVKDGKAVIYAGPWVKNSDRAGQKANRASCDRWLAEHFPDWQSPEAYF